MSCDPDKNMVIHPYGLNAVTPCSRTVFNSFNSLNFDLSYSAVYRFTIKSEFAILKIDKILYLFFISVITPVKRVENQNRRFGLNSACLGTDTQIDRNNLLADIQTQRHILFM